MKRSPRVLSAALAVVLASSLCTVPAYAADGDDPQPGEIQEPTAPFEESETTAFQPASLPSPDEEAAPIDDEAPAAPVQAGSVRATLIEGRTAVLDAAADGETAPSASYAVLLAGPDGYSRTGTAELSAADPQGTVRFDDLADGVYELTVSAPGFLSYRQQIEVKADAVSLELRTGDLLVNLEAAHPGVMLSGDATGDGVIDSTDAAAIVDVLESSAYESSCDMDGDGSVTLADLQIAAANIGRASIEATLTRSVSAAATTASAAKGAVVGDGDVADVVNGSAPVTLKSEAEVLSSEHPVAVEFELAPESGVAPAVGGMTVAAPSGNAIEEGFVDFVYLEGDQELTGQARISSSPVPAAFFRSRAAAPTATIGNDGTIVIDFGGQIAVKKVTLTITKTSGGANLAEISKVEFLNDMAERIPEPDMSVPVNLQAEPGSKKFTVSWDASTNVTGYELSISANGTEEVKRTTAVSLTVTSFGGKKIANGTEFAVKVRSVNGDWRSPWSTEAKVTPKTTSKPDAPEGLKVVGAYRSLSVSWKNMEDTDSYNLFYREKADEGGDYTRIGGIASASYQVTGLKDDTEYQVYVTGVNEIGESGASLAATARTTNVNPAQLPEYRLVNTKNAEGAYLSHIASATYGRGSMVDSPLDAASGTAKSALGLFDDNYGSYLQVNDWDEGGYYPGSNKGVTVEFDEPQTLGMISFAEVQDGVPFGKVNVSYVDEAGAWKTVDAAVQMRTGQNGRKYALAKLAEPVTTGKVKVATGRAWWAPNVVIAEMRFHAYDSLEADIMALYADDLHLELKDSVTVEGIDALQRRLDAPDEVSGEFHPYRTALQTELDSARKLLATEGLEGTVRVHNAISAKRDSSRSLGIGGLNAWQPLGAVAAAGDEIVVYAGAAGKATGSSAPLRLVLSQQHAEGGATKVLATLKAGRNEVTIPQLSTLDFEKGGQLYVEYTGDSNADDWGVRVSGASATPSLDLYHVDDPAERLARTTAYVQALEAYVPQLEARHDEAHAGGDNAAVQYAYDAQNCVLNATDVLLDQMMYSVPAQQILAGLGEGSTDARARKLLSSLDAMDQMMELFYQRKGLASSFADGTPAAVVTANSLPSQHLNIRYTRMGAGAFMYAAGNHIGIEWGSVPGLAKANPAVFDESVAKASGNLFGWGIAHEIGHNINQSQYAYAEVTNNYFAQLARTIDTYGSEGSPYGSTRFSYDDVYQRVTSGDEGRTGSVFTQLAMYWQLALAYDLGEPYQLYGTYQEAFENNFFARVDSYARRPGTAPAPDGVALVLDGGESQNIMRLASAAAERDLTEFFERWGIAADATTAAYVKQFPAEERAICYANDDARGWARAHEDVGAVAGKDVVKASAEASGSEVVLTLGADASAGDSVLGYEIARITYAGGQPQREVVGFSTDGTYEDDASSLGNRAVAYEVTAVDKFLNRSASTTLDAVKLSGDGLQDKAGWTVDTNMVSAQDAVPPATDDDPDAPEPQPASALVVDGDASTVFTGTSAEGDPYLTIDMGKPTQVTAVRYTLKGEGAALGAYRIETSLDGETYTVIKEGSLQLGDDGAATLYFDNGEDPWVCTYDARYLRITGTGQEGKELSVGEIDVFGPSGDNVELLDADGVPAIGILKSDFVYQQAMEGQAARSIPKGSLVFTGSYKGNPAYNVVVLYDADGNVVGGADTAGNLVANQIILAPDPGDAMLGETSEGRWVYWIDPAALEKMRLPKQVRAELYRVDDALTNEGQRLTSDSLLASVPDTLPDIEFNGAASAPSNH